MQVSIWEKGLLLEGEISEILLIYNEASSQIWHFFFLKFPQSQCRKTGKNIATRKKELQDLELINVKAWTSPFVKTVWPVVNYTGVRIIDC